VSVKNGGSRGLSKKVEEMQPSGIRVFFDLVLGMKDVISLGVGEPDFVTPWQIREAGIYSLENGSTSYTSNKGLVKLRMGLQHYLKKRYGLSYAHEDRILVTVGVSQGVDLALRALINPGDRIIIPAPAYVCYAPLAELAGGKAVCIDTSRDGFKLTPRALESALRVPAKALLLNYPCNPTGVSYTARELRELNRILLKHGVMCVSDEIYADLTYDFEHTSFASLPGAKENTLLLNGFSKSYAMTGWRVGYACGPVQIIAAMTKIHQYMMLCAPIMSQMAACEALLTGRDSMEEMKREYRRRRSFIVDGLNRIGLDCALPQGAFYAFASVKKSGLSSIEFCRRLLKEEKVAVVPGTAFGDNGEGYVRISYAAAMDKIKEALGRMQRFLERNRK
jgi:aminotransferase